MKQDLFVIAVQAGFELALSCVTGRPEPVVLLFPLFALLARINVFAGEEKGDNIKKIKRCSKNRMAALPKAGCLQQCGAVNLGVLRILR